MKYPTLEEYFRACLSDSISDFSLRASIATDGRVVFYIHPALESGDTVDYELSGNCLKHNRDIGEESPVTI